MSSSRMLGFFLETDQQGRITERCFKCHREKSFNFSLTIRESNPVGSHLYIENSRHNLKTVCSHFRVLSFSDRPLGGSLHGHHDG